MKTLTVILAVTALGCVQTTTTAKDGSVTVTKAPAPGVLQFAGAAITAYSPRPIRVREEKSGNAAEVVPEMDPRTFRITVEEIGRRWKP